MTSPLPLDEAATRVWAIRRLYRERALDPLAADTALRALRDHPNHKLARLAEQTTREIVREVCA